MAIAALLDGILEAPVAVGAGVDGNGCREREHGGDGRECGCGAAGHGQRDVSLGGGAGPEIASADGQTSPPPHKVGCSVISGTARNHSHPKRSARNRRTTRHGHRLLSEAIVGARRP